MVKYESSSETSRNPSSLLHDLSDIAQDLGGDIRLFNEEGGGSGLKAVSASRRTTAWIGRYFEASVFLQVSA
jgi:hypothetical protein